MIEFGGEVADVLCTTGRYIPGRRPTTPPTSCCASRAARRGCCSARSRPRRPSSFTLFGTKGLAEFSRPNLARFRFVPVSTVAPTGPVTAPPDEIIESAGVRHAQRRAGRIRALHRAEAPLPRRHRPGAARHGRVRRHGTLGAKAGKSRKWSEANAMEKLIITVAGDSRTSYPAQQPVPAAGGHRRLRAAIRRCGEGRRRHLAHPRTADAGRNDPVRRPAWCRVSITPIGERCTT